MQKQTRLRQVITTLLILILATVSTTAYADTNHTIQPGETLYSISRQYSVPVADIISKNQITNPSLIYPGQTLVIPTDGTTPAPPTPTPTTTTTTTSPSATHTVQSGETMYSIARRYSVGVSDIANANGLVNSNLIYVGQQLTIPGADGTTTTTTTTPTPTPQPTTTNTAVHIVSSGETLSIIAIRYSVTINSIMQTNGLTNANYIYVGQALTIPGATTTTTTTTTTPTGPTTANLSGTAFGGQTQTFANAPTMKDIGMNWVKFQYKWAPGDSASAVASLIQAGHNEGFKVLLSIPGKSTYPASINFAAYTNFLRDVASLTDAPDAIEVWNEMNIDFEWPAGQINPSSYVNNMLAPAYNAIKEANSGIWVISGAPAPTGFDNTTNAWSDSRYIQGIAAAGGARYMDCMGVHYNAGATSPSATTGHSGGDHYSWYYPSMVNTYYSALNKPLCFTEIGYLSGDGFGGLPANFAWASNTSTSEHAQWLAEALSLASNDNRVSMFIIFNIDFTLYQTDGDPQAGYAIRRPDGSCPACDTLKAATGN